MIVPFFIFVWVCNLVSCPKLRTYTASVSKYLSAEIFLSGKTGSKRTVKRAAFS
jgi:hypothetical protein